VNYWAIIEFTSCDDTKKNLAVEITFNCDASMTSVLRQTGRYHDTSFLDKTPITFFHRLLDYRIKTSSVINKSDQ